MPTKLEHQNKKLRIVFMGTPDFAVAGLNLLFTEGYDIVGILTAPDKPAGRGRKIQESAVKRYAKEKGLGILQPQNLKDEAFLKTLRALNGNLFVVVAFRMLPKVVWQMPEYGTFNLHASLLPQYRGAAPINWAIINGETKTGVTTFFIDQKIDTGGMIWQQEIAIGEEETAGELHDKLMHLGAELILRTVKAIVYNRVKVILQPEDPNLKPAPKIHKDTCQVNWKSDLQSIYNHIRGLSPYPTAWTTLVNSDEKLSVKIYQVSKEKAKHHHDIGQIIVEKHHMKVAVKEGFILLEKIQLPGKKAMLIKEILNGFHVTDEAHML